MKAENITEWNIIIPILYAQPDPITCMQAVKTELVYIAVLQKIYGKKASRVMYSRYFIIITSAKLWNGFLPISYYSACRSI